ncbi:MAG: hypothetical protein OSA77_14580, partial [Halioglobus sp.]|nr:hypothetical protein [Halioglobus sp.]
MLVQGPLSEDGDKACFKEILTVLEESLQNAAIVSRALAQNTAWHPRSRYANSDCKKSSVVAILLSPAVITAALKS